MINLNLKKKSENSSDLIALGEILLRFDPENERIHNARSFRVFDGGAEYNVARGLSKVFRQSTKILTALAENSLGRLAEDFAMNAGVDCSEIIWRGQDETGSEARNGIYFIERGFGIRAPNSVFDRRNTAVSQLDAGEIDWQRVFQNSRWFHTGGVFAGLSETTPKVATEAMKAARENGVVVSYDLNYRNSIWKNRGGIEAANKLNKEILPFVDVVFGVLGQDFNSGVAKFKSEGFRNAAQSLVSEFPNLRIVASTLRDVKNANCHSFSGICYHDGEVQKAQKFENIAILDRVGSGDSFDSGFIYSLLEQKDLNFAVNCGAAHGALAMMNIGDNSMATDDEVFGQMRGEVASVKR